MRHLRCMFNYDYRWIDLMTLRAAGVRKFSEVEDMIEGTSVLRRVLGPGRFYTYTGFTSESKPLEVTVKMTGDTDMEVHQVYKPSVEDIIDNFSRHCHDTDYPNT